SMPAPPIGNEGLVGGGPPSPPSGSLRPNIAFSRRFTFRQISSRSGGPVRLRLPHWGSLSDMADAGYCRYSGEGGWAGAGAFQAVAARSPGRGNRSTSAARNSGTPAPVSALRRTARILPYSSRSTPGSQAPASHLLR